MTLPQPAMRTWLFGRVVIVLTMAAIVPVSATRRTPGQDRSASRDSDAVRFVAQPATRYRQFDQGIEILAGRGVLRTNRFFSDVSIRFQFQLAEPQTRAVVFVRSLFENPAAAPFVGYRAHLNAQTDTRQHLGQVTGWRQSYSASPAGSAGVNMAPDDWHDCELRAIGTTLTVTIDGVEVTVARDLEELVGYIGFQTERGKLRVRRVQIDPLSAAPDAMAEQGLELTDELQAPTVIRDMKPVYSMEALQQRVQGSVDMRVRIREDGTVGAIQVTQSLHPDLDQSAVAAARKWLFRPATKDGRPVAVFATITMNFRVFR